MITTTQIVAALQTRLASYTPLTDIVPSTSIGNYLPQDTPRPLITYEFVFEGNTLKGEDDLTVTITFNIESEEKGVKQTLEIQQLIRNIMDDTPLTIASGDCYGTFIDDFNAAPETDGLTYSGSMIYTALYGDN